MKDKKRPGLRDREETTILSLIVANENRKEKDSAVSRNVAFGF